MYLREFTLACDATTHLLVTKSCLLGCGPLSRSRQEVAKIIRKKISKYSASQYNHNQLIFHVFEPFKEKNQNTAAVAKVRHVQVQVQVAQLGLGLGLGRGAAEALIKNTPSHDSSKAERNT